MQLCLVRHGIATERGQVDYRDDALRPLTAEGRAKMTAAAAGIARMFQAQLVLSSPLVRARQTADILVVASGGPRLQTHDGLANGDHASVISTVAGANVERIALVGHEPLMSELLSLLMTGSEGRLRSGFKKGGAALVDFDGPPRAGMGTLVWAMPPAALRRLG